MVEGFTQSKEFEERVIEIKRVSKKFAGGNKMGFTALVVVGDRKGRVGCGLGKAKDVNSAVQKGISLAKRSLVSVNFKGNTVPHDIKRKFKSARIVLKPAPKGSGIIAGGAVRDILELVGIRDISSKMIGSSNKMVNIMCTIKALKDLKEPKKE